MAKKKTVSRKATGAPAAKRKAVSKKASAKKAAGKARPQKKTAAKKKAATKKKASTKKVARKKTVAKKTANKKSLSSPTKKTANKKTTSKAATCTRGKRSTAKNVVAKRPADEAPAEVEPRIPKTRLNAKQLAMFKEMLLEKRRELLGDVRTLTKDALGRSRQDSTGDLSSMPIHMADIGSDNWEQDFTLGLIANERRLVHEIDDALARIEDRTYGVCVVTHNPISIARLRAKPWAKYCIEYARKRETGRH